MQEHSTWVVLLALVVVAACAKTPGESRELASVSAAEVDRVAAADDAYAAAEVRGDKAAMERFVDDRFVRNHEDGTTSGKDEFIATVLRLKLVDQTISERSVVVEGNMALVLATTELRFDQSDGPRPVSKLRYTAAYVKRGDEWRMLALHIQPRASK
jgi:ketosteroid isomerase-like protein